MCRSWCHHGRGQGLEDWRRRHNESRCMEDCLLLNKRMKDDKIMVTRNDLSVSTWTIYFTRWPVNGIGGGQHSIVLTALWALPFPPIKLSMCSAWGTWCAIHIPSLLRKCANAHSQTHQVVLEVLLYFEGRSLILTPKYKARKALFLCSGVLYV